VALALVLVPRPVGAQAVSLPTFDPVFQNDSAVRAVVARLGLPDRAEVVPLSVGDPWVASELRIFYLQRNRMLVFMRARVDGEDVSVLREQGPLPREAGARGAEGHAVTARVARAIGEAGGNVEEGPTGAAGGGVEGGPTGAGGEGAEAQADAAAAEAEARADAAERAADRAEEIARRMDRDFKESLGKRGS